MLAQACISAHLRSADDAVCLCLTRGDDKNPKKQREEKKKKGKKCEAILRSILVKSMKESCFSGPLWHHFSLKVGH